MAPAPVNRGSSHRASLRVASVRVGDTRVSPEDAKILARDMDMDEEDKSLKEVINESLTALESEDTSKQAVFISRKSVILNPTSDYMLRWVLFMFVLTVYTAAATPWEVAFIEPAYDSLFVWNRIIDFFFVLDMAVNFNTANVESSGILVVSHAKITLMYLSFWFWMDLIAVFPYDVIAMEGGDASSMKNLKLLRCVRLLRLIKLLRILRAKRMFTNFEAQVGVDYNLVALSKFAIMIFFIVHLMACGLFVIAEIEDAGPDNWVYANELENRGTGAKYITGFYWACMTVSTIGYGDVGIITEGEKVYASFCMMAGASLYAYVVGAICGILAEVDKESIMHSATMNMLNLFMEDHRLPHTLRMQLRRYIIHSKAVKAQTEREGILHSLSPSLQNVITIHMHGDWITNIPFFRGASASFVTKIAHVLKVQTYAPKDDIYKPNDITESMYIIKSGTVVIRGRFLTRHNFFGEDMVQRHLRRRKFNARTLHFVDVYVLYRDDLFRILPLFPRLCRQVKRMGLWMCVKNAFLNTGVHMLREAARQMDHGEERPKSRQWAQISGKVMHTDGTGTKRTVEVKSKDFDLEGETEELPFPNAASARGGGATPIDCLERRINQRLDILAGRIELLLDAKEMHLEHSACIQPAFSSNPNDVRVKSFESPRSTTPSPLPPEVDAKAADPRDVK